MLTELVVEGLGVIERAELSLGPGSNAITGETGAGKTLLVVAIGLLLGDRADRALVRSDSRSAVVEARFTLPSDHPAARLAAAHGFLEEPLGEEVELILGRTIGTDGRGKARVNGRLTSVAVVSEVGATLVEIAGQHEHQRIAAPRFQRDALDAYAGAEAVALASEVAATVKQAAQIRSELEERSADDRAKAREIDVLSFEIDEIEAAQIHPGELDRLRNQARALENAEAIAQGLATATSALGDEFGAEERLRTAHRALLDVARVDEELGAHAERLGSTLIEVGDIASELRLRAAPPDPEALGATRERIGRITRLLRKYGDSETDLLDHLEQAQARLAELGGDEQRVEHLAARLAELESRAAEGAGRLTAMRTEAAARLAHELEGVLARLALDGASVEVRLQARDLYEGGAESVELMVAMDPGVPPRPLAKVASGGELSRVALALHLLTSGGDASTVIFDEVDAGVGGRAAQAVGQALAELAERNRVQTVVVTHLPQVAAYATSHHRVAKSSTGGAIRTSVDELRRNDRIAELSRMLAGLPESERAREHAEELLELAGTAPA